MSLDFMSGVGLKRKLRMSGFDVISARQKEGVWEVFFETNGVDDLLVQAHSVLVKTIQITGKKVIVRTRENIKVEG
jgi:uncharacterized protein with PIN domain